MSDVHVHRVFTRQAVREVDRRSIEEYGIPGVVLMENASRGLALQAMQMMGWPAREIDGEALIVAGGGNNGGDGFAAARHLHNNRVTARILTTKPLEDYFGDAETNLRICRKMGIEVIDASDDPVGALTALPTHALVIDALFGTGLASEVRCEAVDVIAWLNKQWSPVLAVDIPSGLDCDTGEPLGCAVKAAATVTFVGVKKGMLHPQAREYCGEVTVTDIGAPREVVEALGVPM